jgi:hypothetical protein
MIMQGLIRARTMNTNSRWTRSLPVIGQIGRYTNVGAHALEVRL